MDNSTNMNIEKETNLNNLEDNSKMLAASLVHNISKDEGVDSDSRNNFSNGTWGPHGCCLLFFVTFTITHYWLLSGFHPAIYLDPWLDRCKLY